MTSDANDTSDVNGANESSESSEFICPVCGGAMLVAPASEEQVVACPMCNSDVTIPATFVAEEVPKSDDDEDELDLNRITQHATLRRAVYRSRSYAMIAAAVCVVAGVQLGFSTIRAIHTRAFGWATLYVIVMIVCAIGATHFYRRAIALHAEATRGASPSESQRASPDFSTLSDGSQVHQRLHDVQ